MARISQITALPSDQHAKVEALIRQFKYANLDALKHLLSTDGILISRSALGRYARNLKARDGLMPGGEARTVIVIFDRATGSATTVTSSASKDVVLTHISSISSV